MKNASKNRPFQLTFDLPFESAMGRDDYLVSDSNRIALELVESWPNWTSQVVVVAGPTGSGKTHLVEIWRELSNATTYFASELSSIDLSAVSDLAPIAIEDAGEGEFDQVSMFHLINSITEVKSNLLVTSRKWPLSWGITVPDLESRIRMATLVEVSEPDDNLLRQVLFKHFVDRQLDVDMTVVDYLVLRMERSLKSVGEIVDAIDQLTLREKRRVTKPIVAKVLSSFSCDFSCE